MSNHSLEERVLETALTLARKGHGLPYILNFLSEHFGRTPLTLRSMVYGGNTRYRRDHPIRQELRKVLGMEGGKITALDVAHLVALYADENHNSLSACLVMRKSGVSIKDSTARAILSSQKRAKSRLEKIKQDYGITIHRTGLDWREQVAQTKRSIVYHDDAQGIRTEAVIDGQIWTLTAQSREDMFAELMQRLKTTAMTCYTITALKLLAQQHYRHPKIPQRFWINRHNRPVNGAVAEYPVGHDPLDEARQLPRALKKLQALQGAI